MEPQTALQALIEMLQETITRLHGRDTHHSQAMLDRAAHFYTPVAEAIKPKPKPKRAARSK